MSLADTKLYLSHLFVHDHIFQYKFMFQVYDLGVEGKGLSKVACVSQHNITQHAAVVARSVMNRPI